MVTTAIFPSRYVQGKGALTTHLPQELAALGHKALILQDPVVHSTYRDAVATALHGVIEFDIEVFSSECSDEEIARISARAQEIGADVIVGMGGGKTLDTAKATGASLRLPIAVVPTPALEHVIEANTLLSGLGFESGGLAAAHAIHNGLTVLPATHKYWHGEKVAFGTLAMLMLTDRAPELIEEVYQFCEDIGLPTTLADIGLAGVSDDELLAVARASCQTGETMHNEPFTITPEAVQAALRAADAVGQARKKIDLAG
ncbi:iron-containing alcohol dehydrogenase [Salmonella enterica subsp. enterica serovar Bovismorbificans]|nr:iron-containing alcohol dehydrogenase [Salmonella enterica subsp. enterica serovar Bovismorbificans]